MNAIGINVENYKGETADLVFLFNAAADFYRARAGDGEADIERREFIRKNLGAAGSNIYLVKGERDWILGEEDPIGFEEGASEAADFYNTDWLCNAVVDDEFGGMSVRVIGLDLCFPYAEKHSERWNLVSSGWERWPRRHTTAMQLVYEGYKYDRPCVVASWIAPQPFNEAFDESAGGGWFNTSKVLRDRPGIKWVVGAEASRGMVRDGMTGVGRSVCCGK